MEIQIKKTVKAGNSSAVILPRAWLNKNVRVELIKKTPEIILSDIIQIIKKYIELGEIIGIYLTGSYARGDEDEDSDIDILIITNNTDKEMIHEGIYNILLISKQLLKQKLAQDLFPIGQMIKEAEPLLNEEFIKDLKIEVTKKNVKWYIDTTADKLKLIKRLLNKKGKYVDDRVVYTLILRIRTLYIIEKLVKNEAYSKKQFIRMIKRICKEKGVYEGYLKVKNNLEDKKHVSVKEAEKLYNYLKKQLEEIRKLMK